MKQKKHMSVSVKKNMVLFVILILMGLFFTSQNPKFFNLYNLTNMVRQSLSNFLIGCAMMFVIASGYIDLSVGGVMALSAIFYGYLCLWGLNPWLAFIPVMLLGIGMGILNTVITEKLHIPAIMATLATWIITSGLAMSVCKAIPITSPEVKTVTILNSLKFGKIPLAVPICIVVILIYIFLEKKTILGKYAIAIGGNDAAALFSGINVVKMRCIFFCLTGTMAALAGIWQVGRLGSADPTIGTGYEFKVVAACILGGVNIKGGEGTIAGVMIGTSILVILTNGLQMMGIDSFYQDVITGIVLLAAVLLNSFTGKVSMKKAVAAVN